MHEVRLLLTAGSPSELRGEVTGLADWISAPPFVMPHFPVGEKTPPVEELLTLVPRTVRLVACKQSWDGQALIVRLQEAVGEKILGELRIAKPALTLKLDFEPFEIKTVRIERNGMWSEVEMAQES